MKGDWQLTHSVIMVLDITEMGTALVAVARGWVCPKQPGNCAYCRNSPS